MKATLPKSRGCYFQRPKWEDNEKQKDMLGSVIKTIQKETFGNIEVKISSDILSNA